MSFVLSCCSTADLSKAHFAARDIHYICFHFALDGKDYLDDLGESIPFDKFYQADTTHKSEGNGLGLAICASILKLSNGSISVESTPGKGSQFTVYLPFRIVS